MLIRFGNAIGNLGRDPELKQVNGVAVCKFSLGCKVDKDTTEWVDVDVWDKKAENCAKYLSKGKKAFVFGTMSRREYKGKDGLMKTAETINAERVEFLTPPEKTQSSFSGKVVNNDIKEDGIDDIPF